MPEKKRDPHRLPPLQLHFTLKFVSLDPDLEGSIRLEQPEPEPQLPKWPRTLSLDPDLDERKN